MLRILAQDSNPDLITRLFAAPLQAAQVPHAFHIDWGKLNEQVSKDDMLLVMGKKHAKLLQDLGLFKKNSTVNAMRGKVVSHDGIPIMVTYDPFAINTDANSEPELEWDIQLAIRFHNTGSLLPEFGNYRWAGQQDLYDLCLRLNKEIALGGTPALSVDLETIGLDEYAPEGRILTISFTHEEGQADVLRVPGTGLLEGWMQESVRFLLEHPKIKKVGANLKFDMRWIGRHWKMQVINFAFDTGIVGSLINENRSNSLNLHAKIYTPMGGYDDCVDSHTLICTDDLRWVYAYNLEVGDGLYAFDEHVDFKKRRKLRRARVVSKKTLRKMGVDVYLSNGKVIRCSDDHGFLAHEYVGNGPFKWIHAKDLKPECRIQSAIDVEEELCTWDAGYISGLYDGEGYLSFTGLGLLSGISQKKGKVWSKYLKVMESTGLSGFYAREKNTDGVMTSKHSGGDTLRMLQMFRPRRLLEKYGYDGKCIPSQVKKVWVSKVVPIGEIEVISIETDTHTFVAEGVCSHNSFNMATDKSRMDLALEKDPEGFLKYAGGDTDADLRVYHIQKKELLKDPRLANFYVRVIHPASKVFMKMEQRGVYLDLPYYKELESEVSAEIKRIHAELYEFVPARIKNKYADDFKFSRPTILKDWWFSPAGYNLKPQMLTEKTKEPSTKLDHFKMWQDDPELEHIVELLQEYNSATKTMSTYVEGFQEHIRSDGMFHPSYFLYASGYGGTVTGRTSCTAPAYQTTPKHTKWAKPLRKAFIAPPGTAILKLDFSQGELRIVACIANEPTMIAAYQQGVDLHSVTAAKLNNYSFEQFMALEEDLRDELRFGGKGANFGLLYGMMPPGFRAYVRDTYNLKLSAPEAVAYRANFFELYNRLPAWHDTYREYAKKHKQVRSPLGRIRHLPLINSPDSETRSKQERQAINSPIQGCLSDMMLLAMVLIDYYYPELHMFGMTHDEVQTYVPEDEIELWARRLKYIMENLPLQEYFGWTPAVPFLADAEASTENLALCKGMKLN